jgi:hypothetical protein
LRGYRAKIVRLQVRVYVKYHRALGPATVAMCNVLEATLATHSYIDTVAVDFSQKMNGVEEVCFTSVIGSYDDAERVGLKRNVPK